MIFKQWKQVIGLELPLKTQTRRPVKPDEELLYQTKSGFTWWDEDREQLATVATVYPPRIVGPDLRIKWQVGRTYAVQPGRGKKAVGRIRITKIRRERLGDISAEDIFAEGVGIYNLTDGRWYPITVLEVAREEYAKLWDSIYGKGAFERMKDDDVWVLEFERVE